MMRCATREYSQNDDLDFSLIMMLIVGFFFVVEVLFFLFIGILLLRKLNGIIADLNNTTACLKGNIAHFNNSIING